MVTALAGADIDAALRSAGAGTREDVNGTDTVLLDIPTLREHARAAASVPDWDSRWEAMIGYAGQKGWIAPGSTAVRAHLEPVSLDRMPREPAPPILGNHTLITFGAQQRRAFLYIEATRRVFGATSRAVWWAPACAAGAGPGWGGGQRC